MSAYLLSNEELVRKVLNTTLEAGASNSGVVIDVTGPWRMEEVHYLKGVLLARLDGKSPPVTVNDQVHVGEGKTITGLDMRLRQTSATITTGTYAIAKVWYLESKWLLSLSVKIRDREGGIILFPFNEFETNIDEPGFESAVSSLPRAGSVR